MRDGRTAIVLILTLVAGVLPARAAIPGADDPKAYTQHDYLRGKLEHHRRSLVVIYRELGRRDAKWDAAAEKSLDATAVYLTYRTADPIYRPADMPTPEQLLALAKTAADAGCDDPLVSYCRAIALMDTGKLVEARPVFESAVTGMIAIDNFPPFRIAVAAGRLEELLTLGKGRPDAAAAAKYQKLAVTYALKTMGAKLDDKDLRFVANAFVPLFRRLAAAARQEFCVALDGSPDANPWLVDIFFGANERAVAWQARGHGFADTVGEEGWKSFHAHLGKAREYLTAAYKLHPEFPEAAAAMISVINGSGEPGENPRDWFDKAAKAQFDDAEALDA